MSVDAIKEYAHTGARLHWWGASLGVGLGSHKKIATCFNSLT